MDVSSGTLPLPDRKRLGRNPVKYRAHTWCHIGHEPTRFEGLADDTDGWRRLGPAFAVP